MALGDSYATLAELKGYLGITSTGDDTRLTECLSVASRWVETYCGRQFNDAGSATAREFDPRTAAVLEVDDFSTNTGLIVKYDSAGDGTFASTVASTNYELRPRNGVVDGQSGWPYTRILAIAYCWPTWYQRVPLQVTARWGWTAVPSPVKVATIYRAEDVFKLKGAPFGVAGDATTGPIFVRDNRAVMGLLAPYRLHPVMVA